MARQNAPSTDPATPALARGIQYLKESGLWIVLALWLLLYIWRPLVLGFYYDDWVLIVHPAQTTAPFSAEKMAHMIDLYKDRPIIAPVFFVLNSLLGDSYVAWHAFVIVLVLGFVLVFYRFLGSLMALLGFQSTKARYAMALASAGWLYLPWMKGVEAWPTISVAYIVMALFCWSGERLFTAWRQGRNAIWLPALLFGLQALMYEIFYMHFVLFYAFGYLAGAFRNLPRKGLLASFLSFLIVQAGIVFWNRAHSPRPIQADWFGTFTGSLKYLPSILLKSAPEVKVALVIMLVVLLVLTVLGGFYLYRDKSRRAPGQARRFLARYGGVILICLAGVLMSIGLLALGGRILKAVGTFSRSTINFSFWWLVFWTFAFYLILHLPGRWRAVSATALTLSIGLLSWASVLRVQDFAESWRMQRQIVSAAPIEQIRALPPKAVVLFEGPIHINGTYIFYSYYPLSGAMRYFYPELQVPDVANRVLSHYDWRIFLVMANHPVDWDGQVVVQGGRQYPAKQLWLWNYETGEFSRVDAPAHFPKRELNMP